MEIPKDGWLFCIFASQILVNQLQLLIFFLCLTAVCSATRATVTPKAARTMCVREIYPELPAALDLELTDTSCPKLGILAQSNGALTLFFTISW